MISMVQKQKKKFKVHMIKKKMKFYKTPITIYH